MVHVEEDSFEVSASGLITGRISININDKYFPEKEWNDSVVTILNWWAGELGSFFSNTSAIANLSFMEGPFHVRFYRFGNQSRLVSLCKNEVVDEIIMDTDKLKIEAIKGILSAIELSVRKCDKNNWINSETVTLIKNYNRLKKAFPNYAG